MSPFQSMAACYVTENTIYLKIDRGRASYDVIAPWSDPARQFFSQKLRKGYPFSLAYCTYLRLGPYMRLRMVFGDHQFIHGQSLRDGPRKHDLSLKPYQVLMLISMRSAAGGTETCPPIISNYNITPERDASKELISDAPPPPTSTERGGTLGDSHQHSHFRLSIAAHVSLRS